MASVGKNQRLCADYGQPHQCTACRDVFPNTEKYFYFRWDAGSESTWRRASGMCRTCHKESATRRQSENPESVARYTRKYFHRRYHTDSDFRQAIKERQRARYHARQRSPDK